MTTSADIGALVTVAGDPPLKLQESTAVVVDLKDDLVHEETTRMENEHGRLVDEANRASAEAARRMQMETQLQHLKAATDRAMVLSNASTTA